MTLRAERRKGKQPDRRAGAGEASSAELTRSLRLALPKIRWKPRERPGVLTDALGGAIFVLIAGGGWLLVENASHERAPETAAATDAGAVATR